MTLLFKKIRTEAAFQKNNRVPRLLFKKKSRTGAAFQKQIAHGGCF
jgi:hypothetical protein